MMMRRLHVVLPLLKFTLVNIVFDLDASFATKRRRWPWAFFRAGPWRPRQLHVVLLLQISTLVNQVLHLAASFGTTWWHRPWAFFRAGPRRPMMMMRRFHVVLPLLKLTPH